MKWIPACLLLSGIGIALASGRTASAQSLEVRLPKAALLALAEPDGWRSGHVAEALLKANPGLRALKTSGDLSRVSITWTLPDGTPAHLSGRRFDVYRLARGATDQVPAMLSLPPGYVLEATRTEGGDVALVLEPSASPPAALKDEAPAPRPWEWLQPQVTRTLRLLASQRYQAPSLDGLNPDNEVFEIPRHTTEAEARLDLALEWNHLTLTAKPRARWSRDQWSDGSRSGDSEADGDLLLLEGGVKARPLDSLVASFGRENLQWGPSQFVSPSNPFFAENGRGNPVREIPGMDFARAVWVPTANWSVSWISNTGLGEGDLGGRDWHPSHALKLDYLGYEAGGSVLAHGGPDSASSLRGYGQWTASDALLLYGELGLSKGTHQLYPVADAGPLGGHLEPARENDPAILPVVLLGGAYTLEIGPTLSAEYVFNGEGYDASEADLFFDLGHRLGDGVEAGLLPAPGDVQLPARLLRRNYLFVQYLQSEIRNRLSVLFRWAQNLDDGSGLGTGFAEYSLSDRWRLFGYGAGGTGGNRDEFGSYVRWLAVLGVELSLF